MDINQKFIDDVIISLMEMNDRLVALEEMAAEHIAEHEEAAAEAQYKADILAAITPLQDSFTKTAPKAAFLSGNGVIGAEIENKFKQPAPQGVKGGAFVGIVPGSPEANAIFEIAEAERKAVKTTPAPEVEPTTEDSKNELEQVEQASEIIRSHMKKWGMIAFTIHAGEIA